MDETLVKELEGVNQQLADDCTNLQKILLDRRKAILSAAKPENNFDEIPALPQDPRDALESVSTQLQAEAKVLEASMDEKTKAVLVSEKAELDARVRLAALKGPVLDAVAKFVVIEKLKACFNAAATSSISRKSTILSNTMATQEVADALNSGFIRRICGCLPVPANCQAYDIRPVLRPQSS